MHWAMLAWSWLYWGQYASTVIEKDIGELTGVVQISTVILVFSSCEATVPPLMLHLRTTLLTWLKALLLHKILAIEP